MKKYVIFYNPVAGKDGATSAREKLKEIYGGDAEFADVTKIDVAAYLKDAGEDTAVVLAGGDGTLNKFVNAVDCDALKCDVYLYAAGNGNDFMHDIGGGDKPVLINQYIKNLPTVTVNGVTYKFINGVGYGIDGYCCEVGDKLRAEGKDVNYTSIAIKGLLFHFKPKTATVTVDGTTYNFKKCWIAPAMLGRFYGGGMMPTPAQNRLESGHLSVCVMFGKGKIGTLMAFPSIFKGEHVKKTKMVKILEGKEISVKFDAPCALQVDGETILNVTEYTARI